MDAVEARKVIEAILKSGEKTPGLFDLPKVIGVKNQLEACTSFTELIGVLQQNRGLICKSFGISDALFNDGLAKLSALA